MKLASEMSISSRHSGHSISSCTSVSTCTIPPTPHTPRHQTSTCPGSDSSAHCRLGWRLRRGVSPAPHSARARSDVPPVPPALFDEPPLCDGVGPDRLTISCSSASRTGVEMRSQPPKSACRTSAFSRTGARPRCHVRGWGPCDVRERQPCSWAITMAGLQSAWGRWRPARSSPSQLSSFYRLCSHWGSFSSFSRARYGPTGFSCCRVGGPLRAAGD